MTPKLQATCDLIKQGEGFKAHAYRDVASIITIGIGTARTYPNGTNIRIGDTCTLEQAEQWLIDHLKKRVIPTVDEFGDLPDSVYAALCSLAYNVGSECLKNSSFKEPIEAKDWGTFNEEDKSGTGLVETFLKYTKIRLDGELRNSKGLYNRRVNEIKYMLGNL